MLKKNLWTLALCLPLLWAAPGCNSSQAPADPSVLGMLRQGEPQSESFRVNYVHTDSGRVRARLEAPHAVEHVEAATKESRLEMDRGLHLTFFGKAGERESELTANEGSLWRQQGKAEARGKVVLKNAKNEMLETERLEWFQNKDLIRTDAPVRITSEQGLILGTGLESNASFTRYRIFKIRQSTLKVEE